MSHESFGVSASGEAPNGSILEIHVGELPQVLSVFTDVAAHVACAPGVCNVPRVYSYAYVYLQTVHYYNWT